MDNYLFNRKKSSFNQPGKVDWGPTMSDNTTDDFLEGMYEVMGYPEKKETPHSDLMILSPEEYAEYSKKRQKAREDLFPQIDLIANKSREDTEKSPWSWPDMDRYYYIKNYSMGNKAQNMLDSITADMGAEEALGIGGGYRFGSDGYARKSCRCRGYSELVVSK